MPLLEGKKVGLMGNQTTVVGENKDHLVDVLLDNKVDLRFAFAPEHGFRGEIERGEKVSNEVDEKTGLPLYTLYGRNDQADSIVNSVDVTVCTVPPKSTVNGLSVFTVSCLNLTVYSVDGLMIVSYDRLLSIVTVGIKWSDEAVMCVTVG